MAVKASDFPAGIASRVDLRIGCYILFAVTTVTFLLRLYVRIFIAHKLGYDDYLVIISWITEIVHIVAVKLQFDRGVGWHVTDLATLPNGKEVLTRMILWPWVTQALYYFSLGCIKASIAALYLRLAVTPIQTAVLRGVFIIVSLQALSSTIVVAGFLCTPLKQIWTTPSAIGGPTCINILAFNYYNAALFIGVDIFLALSPIAVLKGLRIDRKRRLSLIIMFSLGLLAIGGTIARQVTNAIAITHTVDFTWTWAPVALCSILESSLGIIFVCVPALAPLFKTWVGGSSATPEKSPRGYRSSGPGNFSKIGSTPKLGRDATLLQNTVVNAKNSDGPVDSYEMEHDLGDFSGDSGSERRIITLPGTKREQEERASRA